MIEIIKVLVEAIKEKRDYLVADYVDYAVFRGTGKSVFDK